MYENDNDDLFKYLESKGLKPKRVEGGQEAKCNCAYCGKKGHLYVCLVKHESKGRVRLPGFHKCMKCDAKGGKTGLKRALGDLPDIWTPGKSSNRKVGDSIFLRNNGAERIRPPSVVPTAGIDVKYHAQLAAAHDGTSSDEYAKTALSWLVEERGIPWATLESFKIGFAWIPLGKKGRRKKHPFIAYPYYSMTGDLINFKFRMVSPEDFGKKPKSFMKWTGCESHPYGLERLQDDHAAIILVEGEQDLLAMHALGYDNVLSLPDGANSWDHKWTRYLAPYEQLYICLDNDDTGQDAAQSLADRVGKLRCMNVLLPLKDANDCLMAGHTGDDVQEFFNNAEPFPGGQIVDIGDFEDLLVQSLHGGERTTGISTGYANLDLLLCGWREEELTILTGDTGMGKAGTIESLVLTPDGWVEMGSLKVGDLVLNQDGEAVPVIGVYHQGVKEVFKVTTKDGGTTVVCGEHLWECQTSNDRARGKSRVIDTNEMKGILYRGDGALNISIPTVKNVSLGESLTIDPYLLGFLLGDGSISQSSIRLTTSNQKAIDQISKRLPSNVSLSPVGKRGIEFNLSAKRGQKNPVKKALVELGLHGCKSYEKFIPDTCFNLSHDDRVLLLQGLLDSDGSCEKTGVVRFSSASKVLVEGVSTLVRSLGGVVGKVSERTTSYTHKGQKKQGRISHRITINLPEHIQPFGFCDAKQARVKPRKVTRYIKSIEPAGTAECVCIAVDSPRRLYVTDDYIVTHNTTFLMTLAEKLASRGVNTLYCPFEMKPIQLMRKLVSMRAQRQFMQLDEDTVRAKVRELRDDVPLYFLDAYGQVGLEPIIEIVQYAARYLGIGAFILDPLQYALQHGGGKGERQEIINAMHSLQKLVKTLAIRVIMVVHPAKLPQDRKKSRKVELDDLPGSASIKQDADNVLRLWAKPDKTGAITPHVEVTVLKARSEFARLGTATYSFNPDTLIYHEWDGREGHNPGEYTEEEVFD